MSKPWENAKKIKIEKVQSDLEEICLDQALGGKGRILPTISVHDVSVPAEEITGP